MDCFVDSLVQLIDTQSTRCEGANVIAHIRALLVTLRISSIRDCESQIEENMFPMKRLAKETSKRYSPARDNNNSRKDFASPAPPSSEPPTPEAPTASETSPATTKATPITTPPLIPGRSIIRLLPLRRCPPLQLLLQPLPRLPHLRIAQMHLPIEVIRQSPIIIQSTQIRATHVTDLQLLVTRRSGGVGERFQFSFFFFLGSFCGADFVVFENG